jgi:hypothetical protein
VWELARQLCEFFALSVPVTHAASGGAVSSFPSPLGGRRLI